MALVVGSLSITPLQATMYGTAALVLKMYTTLMIQGGAGFEAGFRPPEDASLMPKAGAQDFEGIAKFGGGKDLSPSQKAAKEKGVRWRRIVSNDLENIPMGLAVAWGTLGHHYSPKTQVIMMLTFTVGRILHTYFYANAKQPHRALAWTAGVVGVVGMTVNGVLGVALKRKF